MPEKPLFSSLAAALTWAFWHTPSVIKPSLMVRMMAHSGGKDADESAPPPAINPDLDPKPAGLDAAAQVAMIQSFVMRMPPIERVHLLAKYSCGDLRTQARRVMCDLVLPLLNSMMRPRHPIYLLVCRYYGRPVMLREIAGMLTYVRGKNDAERRKNAWSEIKRLDSQVVGWLKDVATRAEERAYEGLQRAGVIT